MGLYIGPSEKTVDPTLTLRFFIQNNEDISLQNMAKLYLDSNIEPRLSTQFGQIRDRINSYLEAPSNLSISEAAPLTHRDIFELFVYGDLAHANPTKVANYRSIRQTAFFPLAR